MQKANLNYSQAINSTFTGHYRTALLKKLKEKSPPPTSNHRFYGATTTCVPSTASQHYANFLFKNSTVQGGGFDLSHNARSANNSFQFSLKKASEHMIERPFQQQQHQPRLGSTILFNFKYVVLVFFDSSFLRLKPLKRLLERIF
jgi:hypothetical protein